MSEFKEMPEGKGYGVEIEGEEAKHALHELGWGQTPEGGWKPGTKVKKVNSKIGDVTSDGTIGFIKGGIQSDLNMNGSQIKHGYIVKWDDPSLPEGAVNFVVDIKLEKLEG